MKRHLTHHLFSLVIIVILVFPIATTVRQGNNNSTILAEPIGIGEVAGTNTWHDDCSSTSGWISQAPSSGFDPKHPILESGTLSSTGGYLVVTGIADPVTERKGPLYIKDLGDAVSIDSISMFQAEVGFTYVSNVYGFLSVYLFDENKQKAVMLRLHDAWAASESHPESVFFTPGEVGDGTVHDEILFGSWSGYLRFWYDESTGSLVGELDDGTPNQATLETSGNFNPDRPIKYIGIQWSRHPGAAYGEDTYRLLDIQLTYDVSESTADWLTGWNNRKAHQILGTPGAGTNYQVEIIVNYGSGTDTDSTVYTDYECQTDFDDIRFTDNDGGTLLDYWVESYFDSENATFWVEIKDNLDVNVSIYIYYGNPNCTTASNGTKTFVFFDDFENNNFNRWDTSNNAWSIQSSIVKHGSYAAWGNAQSDNRWCRTVLDSLITADVMFHTWVRVESTFNYKYPLIAYEGFFNPSDEADGLAYIGYIDEDDWATYNGTPQYYETNTVTPNTWYEYEVAVDFSNGLYRPYIDGLAKTTQSLDIENGTSLTQILTVAMVTGTIAGTNSQWQDDFYIRKYVHSEPIHGTWSEVESWLDGWDYRKSHEILGSSGAGTNYQIEIIVHYGYGTSVGKDVYCEERCQPDFDDIRFTDDDGITLLDYWTESVAESDVSTFWIKVADDLNVDTTIYMYFGNSTVSTLSNGTATFIFFDDYENNNLDRWDEATGVGFSCATDQVMHGTYALKFDSTPGADIMKNLTETGDPLSHDFMVHSWVRDDNQLRGGHAPLVKSQSEWWIYACRGYNSQFSYLQDAVNYVPWPQNSVGGSDQWFEINVGFSMSTDVMRAWKNEFYMGEIGLIAASGASVPDDLFQLGYGQQSNYVTWWDDTFVRKWVINEPVHGAWGENTTISWHHDCSDTTGFVYNDTWNMNWMDWTITTGTLSSDGSKLSITYVPTGTNYHGPVYEYELAQSLRVRDINTFSAIMDAVNSPASYVGYEVVMLGDAERNPVIFFSFGDGWADYSRGAYGISYVYENGSRVSYGSGYPITWTSFSGEMNVSYTESGLMAYVEGIGQDLISGLSEVDFNREIKYVAIASARFGSAPLFPVLIDDLRLNYVSTSEPLQASITDVVDFWYEASDSGNTIEWTVANFNPTSYELWRDGGLLTSDTWPGGSTIEIDIDNLSPGEYNYTIIIYGDSTVVSDSVIVTVLDLTVPSLGRPADAVYEYGTTGHTIVWSVSDLYPGEYVVTRDSTLLESDSWTSGVIVIDTDGLGIGVYTYMIAVTDTSVNLAFDMVTITVVDTTAPILNHPSDIVGNIASASIQVTWQPTDLLPFNYAIYENGTQVDSGTWTSGENLTYTLEDLTTGWYNITIVVWDTSGNYARDMVIVNIEEESIQPIGDILVISISIGSIGVIVVIVGLICRNKGGVQSAPPDTGYSW